MRVYLDNYRTTKLAPEVLAAMRPYLTKKFQLPSGLYSGALENQKKVAECRKLIAEYLNVTPEEIYFIPDASWGNRLILENIPEIFPSISKPHVLTSIIEHSSILTPLKKLEKLGRITATYLKVNRDGLLETCQLSNVNCQLLSCSHFNHAIGVTPDLEKIFQLKQQDPALKIHLNAEFSFGKIKYDLQKMPLDFLTASADKFHGPQGIGLMYARKPFQFSFQKEIDDTTNIAGIVGLTKAVELCQLPVASCQLPVYFWNKLQKEIPHLELNGSLEYRDFYNLNVTFKGIEGEALALRLNLEGIAVSTGSACAQKNLQSDYVIIALGKPYEDSHGSLRFTFSRYTTQKELDYTVGKLKKIVRELRAISPL